METQEKLTLKELVWYLPYGLKVAIMGEAKEVDGNEPMIFELVGLYTNYVEYHEIGRTVTEQCVFSDCFPILRNLSDLTKEITHNGETFVPIEKLRKDYSGFYFESNPELLIKSKNTSMYISLNWTNEFHKTLYEWHFDIHGLIEKGKAIDINNLLNE